MVEPLSLAAGKARIQRPGNEAASATGNGASTSLSRTSQSSAAAAAGESVSISIAAQSLPDELKSGPPIDIETVTRIREAIAENRYPIDLQAITESLFQSFLEVSS